MALQLPDWTSLGVQNPNPGDNRPTYSGQNPEAEAVGKLGAGLQTLGHGAQLFASEEMRQANLVNASLARADLHTRLAKTKLDIENESDPDKIDKLTAGLNDQLESASQVITDPGARNLWIAHSRPAVTEAELVAIQRQRKIYNDRFVAGAAQQMQDRGLAAQQTTDPAVRAEAQQDIARIITSMANAGVITDTKAQDLSRAANESIVTGNAQWLDANGDPRAALNSIRANQNALPGDVLDRIVRGLQPRLDKQVGISAGRVAIGGTGAPPKGPLDPAFVTAEAQRQGVDPILAHTMFDIESSYGANTGNDISPSNTGAAQMAPANAPGGMNDTLENQVRLGIGSLAKRTEDLRNSLGREPAPWEIYAAHQQGASGYAQLAAAAPDKLAVDIRPAINISNNVPKGTNVSNLTAGQFLNLWHQEYNRHAAKFANVAGNAPIGTAAPGPPPMRSREDLLASIPANDPLSGEPLSPEQTQIAESYVNRQYNLQQQQTEEARARLTQALSGGIQMLADGRDFSYDEPTIRSLLPPEKADLVIQKLDDAKAEGAARNEISGMTPQEIATQSAQLRSTLDTGGPVGYQKRRAEINGFNRAVEKHFGALGLGPSDKPADPAAYIAATNPRIGQLYAARGSGPEAFSDYATAALAEQARLGVPPEKTRVLSTKEAPGLVAQIMSNPEQAPVAMQQLANQTGLAWPQVWRDLTTVGKMPPAFQAVGTLENQADAGDLARALGVGVKDEKSWDQILSSNARHDIRAAVDGSDPVNNLLRSLAQSGSSEVQVAGVKNAIEMLAYAKTFYRQDPSAAANAIKAFTEKYEFMPNGGGRVPSTVFGAVTTNAANTLRALTPDDINIPQTLTQTPAIPGTANADDYMRVLKANPTWITAPRGDALWLMDPQGRIVRDHNNVPVAVRFDTEAPPPQLGPDIAPTQVPY